MKFGRRYSKPDDVYAGLTFAPRTSKIVNPDGSAIFEAEGVLVPESWSQVATDVLAQKYFRRAGVPRVLRRIPEEGVPEWLWRSEPDDVALAALSRDEQFGAETDSRQVFERLAGTWTYWGYKYGYFDSEDDARVYFDEMRSMLARQIGAPNSPQWFNTGLHWAYGIAGPAQGHWYVDGPTGEAQRSTSTFERPQVSACLPYHAPITTPSGPMPIGEIVERGLVGLPVFDRDGITRVAAVKDNGTKPVFRITLLNGNSIEATADHVVLTKASKSARPLWKRVNELTPNDRLVQRVTPAVAVESRELVGAAVATSAPVSHMFVQGDHEAMQAERHEPIVSIEPLGSARVFDIETESHTFLTNNIVVHNCYILGIEDDLVNEGGIFDGIVREARIFKYGSGSGANYSKIRSAGERLSGGGTSSGLMSFLKVFDRAAGAIKSGGTTRRAAKMVVLNADHPDIEEFVTWKVREEQKVADLVAGSIVCEKHLNAVIAAAHDDAVPESARLDPALNSRLRTTMREALHAGVPSGAVQNAVDYARQGYRSLRIDRYDTGWDSEAYATVSGQNSNNSVRLPNAFFKALDAGEAWTMTSRTTGGVTKSIPASDLWERISLAAWQCADPGLQFDDTIQEWNTCSNDERINATNPCSEFIWLDDSACNLASLNLGKFLDEN
ncbi:MAG: hypothetical protein ABI346_05635, partial [Candidatus Baltobacteraceae bacterium]